jgi:dolichol-phosphate mannosyltransferase
MTFLSGSVSVLLGLIAELLVRTYYESQGKLSYSIRDRRGAGTRS